MSTFNIFPSFSILPGDGCDRKLYKKQIKLFFFFTLKGYWLRENKNKYKKNPVCRQTL